jgi:hypothetical protein
MKKLRQAFSNKSKQPINTMEQPSNPATDPKPQPQSYDHILLGSGGVLSRETLGDLQQSVTFVGTTAAFNTVGIFFEISDSQCFIAHIDMHVTRPSSTDPAQKHYSTNYKTAALLREALVARLRAAIPEEHTQRMRDTLVITCARLSGQEPRIAEVVAKTAREWLGAGLSGGGRVAAAGSGFVAGWPGAGSVVFGQEPDEGWSAVKCGLGEGAWSFGVEEAVLEPSEESW